MFYFPNEDILKKNNFIPPYCTQIFRKRIFASHPTAQCSQIFTKRIFSPTLLHIDIHQKEYFLPPYCTQIFTKRIFSSHPTVHRYSQKEYFHPTLLQRAPTYEHVEQQDGDEDLEKNKDDLGHVGIGALTQLLVLKYYRNSGFRSYENCYKILCV